jgi:hypothetical protein
MKNFFWSLLLLLVAGAALAQPNQTMGSKTPSDPGKWVYLRIDDDGTLLARDPDRDRDFSGFINCFNAVVLNYGQTYQMNQPRYIGQFTRAALMISWGMPAAADSDSVIFIVRVYGKTSLNSGNYFLWTPFTNIRGTGTSTSGDTCFASRISPTDTSTATSLCIAPAPSFVVGRKVYPANTKVPASAGGYNVTSNQRMNLRSIPSWSWRFAGTTGVCLNLADDAGNPFPFPYIWIEVINISGFASPKNMTGLTCDIWPRVN